jgi:bacillithiol system protein YtxJ
MLNPIRHLLRRLSAHPTAKESSMHELTRPEDLESCLAASEERPIFVYKHSTACPISWGAADRVTSFLREPLESVPEFYQVLVIESRAVSNLIANELDVPHKSPQLILVKDRKALWSTSHQNINRDTILQAIEEHLQVKLT